MCMSTTVLSFPDWFDESIVNKIAGEQLFANNELHDDQLADLWGFVKRFQPSDAHYPTFSGDTLAVFVELCHAVEIDKLRYEIGGQTELSPNRLAVHISHTSRRNSRSHAGRESHTKRTVDVQEMRNRSEATTPIHSVRLVGDEVVVTIDDTDVHVKKDGIYGTDAYENTYQISFSSINAQIPADVLLDSYVGTKNPPGTSIVRISTQQD